MKYPQALALLAAASVAAGLSGGCVTTSQTGPAVKKKKAQTPTQMQQAEARWDAARGGVLLSLAEGQYQNGQLDACRRTVDDALRVDPRRPALHLLAGKLAIEEGRLPDAERSLAEAARLDPKGAEADYLLGVVAERWQRPGDALAHYAAANDKAPGEPAYLLARAEAMVALGDAAGALALVEGRVVYFENSPAVREACGELMLLAGRPEDAVAMFRQASHLDPASAAAREGLALSQFYAGHWADASASIESLVADESRPDLLLALGECRLRLGRPAEARAAFQRAARADSAEPLAWLSVSKAALASGDFALAEDALMTAARLAPELPAVHLMGGYLRLRQGDFGESLIAFDRAAELDPADPVAACMAGYALDRAGRPADARDRYRRALAIDPDDELASSLMAAVE